VLVTGPTGDSLVVSRCVCVYVCVCVCVCVCVQSSFIFLERDEKPLILRTNFDPMSRVKWRYFFKTRFFEINRTNLSFVRWSEIRYQTCCHQQSNYLIVIYVKDIFSMFILLISQTKLCNTYKMNHIVSFFENFVNKISISSESKFLLLATCSYAGFAY